MMKVEPRSEFIVRTFRQLEHRPASTFCGRLVTRKKHNANLRVNREGEDSQPRQLRGFNSQGTCGVA